MRYSTIIAAAAVIAIAPSSFVGHPGPVASTQAAVVDPDDELTWLEYLELWLMVLCEILDADCDFSDDTADEMMREFRIKYAEFSPASVPAGEESDAREHVLGLWSHIEDAKLPTTVNVEEARRLRDTLRSFYGDVGGDPSDLD